MLVSRALACQRIAVCGLCLWFIAGIADGEQRGKAGKKHGEYFRVHQRALATITAGNPQKAVSHLKRYAKDFGSDAETEFMLTIAHAQTGDLNAAVASMKKALKLGLPPGRFLAGPRELLEPLRERMEYQNYRDRWSNDMIHGPMLGDITHASAKFWFRALKDARIYIYVEGKFADEDVERIDADGSFVYVMIADIKQE